MNKRSVKNITVHSLISFVLIAALVLMAVTAVGFRSVSHRIIVEKAVDISRVVIAGLTSHMKAGIMDRRDYYLSEISSLEEVRSMNVVRGPGVVAQYGPGQERERVPDSEAAAVFDTGKPVLIVEEFASNPRLRAVIPYVASSKGSLNCLNCHRVQEGTVLGAVDIDIDLTEYRNLSLKILTVISTLSFIFLVLLIINTFGTIERYVARPLQSLIAKAREAYLHKRQLNPDAYESAEFAAVASQLNLLNTEILSNQEQLKSISGRLVSLHDEIDDTLRETVFTLGSIVERRSKETHNHNVRVARYSTLLATRLGLPEREVMLIASASPLHDLGKIGIPDSILLKPGKLTDEEYEAMKSHTQIGHALLSHSRRDILNAAAIIAHQHHEKWDGGGYPQGLAGEDIHVFGRIVGVADVFDALITSRTYKPAWTLDQIVEWYKTQSGQHFDPRLVEIFLANLDGFAEIYRNAR